MFGRVKRKLPLVLVRKFSLDNFTPNHHQLGLIRIPQAKFFESCKNQIIFDEVPCSYFLRKFLTPVLLIYNCCIL